MMTYNDNNNWCVNTGNSELRWYVTVSYVDTGNSELCWYVTVVWVVKDSNEVCEHNVGRVANLSILNNSLQFCGVEMSIFNDNFEIIKIRKRVGSIQWEKFCQCDIDNIEMP